MLLATGPSFELVKFFQILCWIILPAALLVTGFTVFTHYRRKRNDKKATADENNFINASPELLGYTNGDGEYIFFDHSSLISEYKKKLSGNHARYTALQHDYNKLKSRYSDLAAYAAAKFFNYKSTDMETTYEQMPKSLQNDIMQIAAAHRAEKEEWQKQLKQINQVNKNLENETQALRDQLNMQTAAEDEKTTILNRWKEENALLKQQVAEQQYLQDVLDDKKAELAFLQNQSEQRVKNNHLLEQQRMQAIAAMEEEKQQYAATIAEYDALKNELLRKQEETDKLHTVLCGKEEQLTEAQQLLSSKLDHITWLENVLQETKQQNETVHALAADNKDLVISLQEQLSDDQAKIQHLEQRLVSCKQMLLGLSKSVSSFLGEESNQSPVIALRPQYLNGEEIAMQ